MKTMYMQPDTKVVKVNTSYQILAGSPGYGGTTGEDSGNLSRGSSKLWDDDED